MESNQTIHDVIKFLNTKKYSGLDCLFHAFGDSCNYEEKYSPSWYPLSEIQQGPQTFLRGPLGFWAIGQFGTGEVIGIYGGRVGIIEPHLYGVNFSAEFQGMIPLSMPKGVSLYSLDEKMLLDNHCGWFSDRQNKQLSLNIDFNDLKQACELVIKPIFYYGCFFDDTDIQNKYQSLIESILGESMGYPISHYLFWRKLSKILSLKNTVDGDWKLSIEENVLCCMAHSFEPDEDLIIQLHICSSVAAKLGYSFIVESVNSMLMEGGLQ